MMTATPTVLPMWVVYAHPRDFPDKFVARKWLTNVRTDEIIVADDLESLRATFRSQGLVALTRDPSDDPVIVETWI